jgi:hypothetical protein
MYSKAKLVAAYDRITREGLWWKWGVCIGYKVRLRYKSGDKHAKHIDMFGYTLRRGLSGTRITGIYHRHHYKNFLPLKDQMYHSWTWKRGHYDTSRKRTTAVKRHTRSRKQNPKWIYA